MPDLSRAAKTAHTAPQSSRAETSSSTIKPVEGSQQPQSPGAEKQRKVAVTRLIDFFKAA